MNPEYTWRLEKIEAVLQSWLPESPGRAWLESVFSLPGDSIPPELARFLVRPGWDLLGRGGKRWRPLLMLLVAESLGGAVGAAAALPLTPLVELPHNASLIHDDIEDNSDERRGKPAVHILYGGDTAINGGAFLYFLPLACLKNSAFQQDQKNRIYGIWGEYMRRLHLGQAMDIAWHRDYHSLPGLEEYRLMCSLKTGCLARLAAVLGVYCADPVGDDPARILGEGAEKLGVGFQILDDVKNLTTGIPGKKRGDDITEGKKSLPVLLYLHRYPEQRDFAARCFSAARLAGTGAPEVEEFIGALEKAGILEEAENQGLELIRESRECFTSWPFAVKGRELFGGLFDLLS